MTTCRDESQAEAAEYTGSLASTKELRWRITKERVVTDARLQSLSQGAQRHGGIRALLADMRASKPQL